MKDKEKQYISMKEMLTKRNIEHITNCNCRKDKDGAFVDLLNQEIKELQKEKQIEEMAKEIFNTCAWRFGKPNDYKEVFNDIAEDLIKLNYRKLPEDSVVISREELEEKYEPSEKFMSVARELEDLKQNLEDKVVLSREEYAEYVELRNSEVAELVKENKVLGKQCLDWMKLYHKQLTKTKEASKETAEKFYKKVRKLLKKVDIIVDGDEGLVGYEESAVDKGLTEIAKQFGVEIKE